MIIDRQTRWVRGPVSPIRYYLTHPVSLTCSVKQMFLQGSREMQCHSETSTENKSMSARLEREKLLGKENVFSTFPKRYRQQEVKLEGNVSTWLS